MKIYTPYENKLILSDVLSEDAIWIDLYSPTQTEKEHVEKYLAVSIPTKEQMQEIEASSRLYQESEAHIMTLATLRKEDSRYKIVNVTFLLKKNVLVTIRYDEISPFTLFIKTVLSKPLFPVDCALSLLLGLLETFIEKIADTLEMISLTIEQISEIIFTIENQKNQDLRTTLVTMGLQGEINSLTRESLSTITRMISYLKYHITKEEEELFINRFATLSGDATDLKDYSAFLGHKVSFILDASLGLINIEQNNIIKIFSIAAVVLLPPTLIASIYGMNFQFIPELKWPFGYPFVLLLMFLSAILPLFYFKKRGWL